MMQWLIIKYPPVFGRKGLSRSRFTQHRVMQHLARPQCLWSPVMATSRSRYAGGVRGGGVRCAHANMSTSFASKTDDRGPTGSISPDHWKVLYRAFLLRVHPDFFHDLPEERSVNEKNLQALSMHLGERDVRSNNGWQDRSRQLASGVGSGARLVFFLKGATGSTLNSTDGSSTAADSHAHEHLHNENSTSGKRSERRGKAPHENHSNSAVRSTTSTTTNGGSSSCTGKSDPSAHGSTPPVSPPTKVMLPLRAHRNSTKLELMHLLQTAGVALPPGIPTTPGPPVPPLPERGAHPRQRESTTATTPFGWDEDDDWAGMEDLFGGGGGGGRSSPSHPFHNSRRYPAGSGRRGQNEQRDAEGDGQNTIAGLGFVLDTEAGRSLVRERRGSARNVRRLVVQLQDQYGFGEFTFRCGWSKSNLCVALDSLLSACATHRAAFSVPDFGGLGVVLRNDPSVLHQGEIRLCPADVPLEWVSVLQGVTTEVLSTAKDDAEELGCLEKQASAILRGATLSKGLSCSTSRYHMFLSTLCTAEREQARKTSDDDAGLAHGDWSELRCKVEEGFGRVSTVLEDGAIQLGSDMTLATVWKCLSRDFAHASAVSAESKIQAVAATRAAKHCRERLGLDSIDSAPGVTFAQMATACECLTADLYGEEGNADDDRMGMGKSRWSRGGGRGAAEGDMAATASAVRRRLRGHSVKIVGERHGSVDGVTEDGEIAIRWNYWEGGRRGREWTGAGGHAEDSAAGDGCEEPSPFSFSAAV